MRGSQPWRTNRARVLRANQTSAEDRLWEHLRAKRLGGHKFVRQAPVGDYFVDFLCRQVRLIVEVDGATYSTEAERAADERRDVVLAREGFTVLRVRNSEIYEDVEGVCETILAALEERRG